MYNCWFKVTRTSYETFFKPPLDDNFIFFLRGLIETTMKIKISPCPKHNFQSSKQLYIIFIKSKTFKLKIKHSGRLVTVITMILRTWSNGMKYGVRYNVSKRSTSLKLKLFWEYIEWIKVVPSLITGNFGLGIKTRCRFGKQMFLERKCKEFHL